MRRKLLVMVMVLSMIMSSMVSGNQVFAESSVLLSADFETDTDGFGARGTGQGEVSSTYFHEGTSSLRIYDRTDYWHGSEISLLGKVNSGVTYTSSVWVYQESGVNQTVKLSLQSTDDNGQAWNQLAVGDIPTGTWTEITGSFALTENGTLTEATVYLEAGDTTLEFYVDDVLITYEAEEETNEEDSVEDESSMSTNYLDNTDFETDLNQWRNRGDGIASIVTENVHAGSQALSVTGRTSNWHGAEKDVLTIFKSGVEYTNSLWVYQESGSDQNIKLSLQSTDDSGQNWNQMAIGTVPSGVWTELLGIFTLPENGTMTEALIYVEADDASLEFLVDDVVITYDAPDTDDGNDGASGSVWQGMTTSFETGFDGFTPRIGGEVVELNTEVARTSSSSLKVSNRVNNYDGVKFEYSELASSGTEYQYSVWVYQESGTDQSIMLSIQKELATTSYENIGSASLPSGQWTNITGSYNLNYSDDLKHFSLYLEASTADLSFYIDDVTISVAGKSDVSIQDDITGIYQAYKDYFSVGVAIPSGTLSTDVETELVTKHFNSITAENDMKPENILSTETRGQVNNTNNDLYYNYAKDQGLMLRGHTLVWHSQTPDWFFKENYEDDGALVSREVMLSRMDDYIEAVVKEYDGDILYAWDVVNEAIDTGESDNMRDSLWKQVVGSDFVEKAFEYTRKHTQGMDVKLFYNDYNVNDAAKRAAIYDLVTDLYDKGLLDGIGLQSHISIDSPSISKIEETIRLFGDYGLEVQITELDIDVYTGGVSSYDEVPDEVLVKQGYRYKELFEMFKDNSDVITNVTVWGLTDNRSWLNYFPVVRGNWPLIFDKDYQAKYAYYGIVDPDSLPVFSQEISVYKGNAVVDGVEDFIMTVQNSTDLDSTATTPKAEHKAAWDEEGLYVEIYVEDITLDEEDSVLIMLDGDSSKSVELESSDIILSINRGNETSFVNGSMEGIETYVSESSRGYLVELKLPITDLAVDGTLGYDFGIVDGDASIKWNDQYDNTSYSPKRFGTLILNDEFKMTQAKIGKVKIDGKMDYVWKSANEVEVNNYSQNSLGATAKVKTLWNKGYLYVYAVITDPLLSKESTNVWEQDSLEIFIDENNNRTSAYELDDVQYRINFDNEVSIGGGPSDPDFESATTITEDGYVVEAQIPFNLEMEEEGMVIGFDLQVNDDHGSGSRESISNWSDLSGTGWKNTQNFGLLILDDMKAKKEKSNSSSSSSSNSSSDSSTDETELDEVKVPHLITIPYKDMKETHWSALAVSVLSSKGVFEGNTKGEFLPEDAMTRAEFVKVIVKIFDLNLEEALENFDDVNDTDWFSPYIASAKEAGILMEEDGDFRPDEPIIRQDMAEILYGAMKESYEFNMEGDITLVDFDQVSDTAKEAIKALNLAGVLEGDEDSFFNPASTNTRAEVAQMLYRASNLIEVEE